MNEVVVKGALLSKVHLCTYLCSSTRSYVEQEGRTLQEEGLTNEDRHHLQKQARDKRGLVELQHL